MLKQMLAVKEQAAEMRRQGVQITQVTWDLTKCAQDECVKEETPPAEEAANTNWHTTKRAKPTAVSAISDSSVMEKWRQLDRIAIPTELNGDTGYMEAVVPHDFELEMTQPYAFRTFDGRPGVLFSTIVGNVVLFQRYSDDPDLWVKNVPHELEMLFRRNLTLDDIAYYVGLKSNPFQKHIVNLVESIEFTDKDGNVLNTVV